MPLWPGKTLGVQRVLRQGNYMESNVPRGRPMRNVGVEVLRKSALKNGCWEALAEPSTGPPPMPSSSWQKREHHNQWGGVASGTPFTVGNLGPETVDSRVDRRHRRGGHVPDACSWVSESPNPPDGTGGRCRGA